MTILARKKLYILSLVSFVSFSLTLAMLRKTELGGDLFSQINILSFFYFILLFSFLRLLKAFNFETVLFTLLLTILFFTVHQTALLNVDRSRSYYIIGWVYSQKVSISNGNPNFDRVESMEKLNPSAMKDRLEEQISRGYVLKDGSTLRLSISGKGLYLIADLLSSVYNLRNWEVNKT